MTSSAWPPVDYEQWSATCDTLHAHTQVLGKLAVELPPPQPQLQHAALRLTPRGWETPPLPAPDGAGSLLAALDLRSHEALVEHSDGREVRVALTPNRPVADVTRDVLDAVERLSGPVAINPKPQEVWWEVPLDQDYEHTTYDPDQVAAYFIAASEAAGVLAEFRAPYRGRSTPVNAWWGDFDLSVVLFSGRPADPPSDDFIIRNSADAEAFAFGWWPGDRRYGRAAFVSYLFPAPEALHDAELRPEQAHWDGDLGEFVLDWEDIRQEADPHGLALEFARSAFEHASAAGGWDSQLASSALGVPPPIH
jgi:Family of unknown function (DUF5996)